MSENELIWSFGYGSNMDVASVEGKKNIKVLGKDDLHFFKGSNLLSNLLHTIFIENKMEVYKLYFVI